MDLRRVVRRCFRIAPAIVLALAVAKTAAAAQSLQAPGTVPEARTARTGGTLELHTPIERQLAGGQTDEFTVTVQAGQFLRIVAEQKGIDVVLSIIDPKGTLLVTADTYNGSFGPEPASIIADITGTYRVKVASFDPTYTAAKYVIQVTDLRSSGAQDETRISAERKLFQAVIDSHGELTSKQHALTLAQDSARLWHVLQDGYEEALCLYFLGFVNFELGENQKALDYYRQALVLKHLVADGDGEARILNGAGLLYWTLGENQKALENYQQALPLVRAAGDNIQESKILSNIGSVYLTIGQNQKALEYFQQALSIENATGFRYMATRTLSNLGRVYDAIGDYQKSMEYYRQALSVARATDDRLAEGKALSYMGRVYSEMGENQTALESYQQALTIQRAVGDVFDEARTLGWLMHIWKEQGNVPLAIFFGKQAVNTNQQLRRKIQDLEKQVQETFLGTIVGIYRELADLLLAEGRLPEVEQVLGMLKEQEFREFTRGTTTSSTALLTPDEQKAESILLQALEWQSLRETSNRSPEQQARYQVLSKALTVNNVAVNNYWGLLEKALQRHSKDDHTIDVKHEASATQSVLRKLPAGTVVVYTLVLDDRLDLIVIAPYAMVPKSVPVTRLELAKAIEQFREAVRYRKQGDELLAPARKLYEWLVAPIADELERAHTSTIAWSLDGVLRYLPVNALYDGRRFLIQRYASVIYTPSNTNHLEEKPNVSEWKALGLGVSKQYERAFTPLPAVPAELRTIVRDEEDRDSHGPLRGRILLDDAFTEQALKDQLVKAYPLVHIASHFVMGMGTDDSYLLLGGKEKGGGGYRLKLSDIETSQELEFDKTALLTLSACETAISNTKSDGKEIDSLATIGRARGAQAVLATLWDVNDASTGGLMADFYQRWTTSHTLPKSEALRQAQLALLQTASDSGPAAKTGRGFAPEDAAASAAGAGTSNTAPYSHPYFWAPFILMGNWQ